MNIYPPIRGNASGIVTTQLASLPAEGVSAIGVDATGQYVLHTAPTAAETAAVIAALSSVYVGLSGDQTVAGEKSFTSVMRAPLYLSQSHSPAFSYTDGRLTGITYANGATKTIAYNPDGSVATVTTVAAGRTVVKTVSYNDGAVSSIAEAVT